MRDATLTTIRSWAALDDPIISRLDHYVDLLRRWNSAYNLVGKSTLDDSWNRHILDGAQLVNYLDKQEIITDFGSGAGVPGVVLALLGYTQVHLIESNRKKCLFLEQVKRETGCNFTVHHARIEALTPWKTDSITCRAFAEIADIFEYGAPFSPSKYVLLKGQSVETELENARSAWDFVATTHPSALEGEGREAANGHVCVIENVQKIG